jgi:aryl-alcohol dehydrogenase-like predicted oxidoreductase
MTFGELPEGTVTHGTSSAENSSAIWRAIGQVGQGDVDKLVGRSIDAGINFLDTADIYSAGQSEEITGRALRNLKIERSSVVIATKAFGAMGPGPNDKGASRVHLVDALKNSLRRLQTEYVDLYQIHGLDSITPVEETLSTLNDLVRQGLVRYIGCSNWMAWQVAKANGISAHCNYPRFESLQAYYSIAGRELERDIIPFLQSERVGLMVWSPLAGGYLSGKVSAGNGEGTRRATMAFPPVDEIRGQKIIEVMRELATAKGVSVAQIALAWLLRQPSVTSVIIGAKRLDQLEHNLRATTVSLADNELAQLSEVSALAPEYPRWMMDRQSLTRIPTNFVPAAKDA